MNIIILYYSSKCMIYVTKPQLDQNKSIFRVNAYPDALSLSLEPPLHVHVWKNIQNFFQYEWKS